MNDVAYSRLIDEICEHSKATPSRERHERCDLGVDGTLFTLMPARGRDGVINAVAYFGDVGPLPETNRDEAAVALLEANLFMVGQDSPCFCCNPETGHVLITGRIPLDPLTAESVLQFLSSVAYFALEWRELHLDPVQGAQPTLPIGPGPRMSRIRA